MTEPTSGREFPLREAHNLVRDLMTPNPWIYWLDFLLHISLGWAAFAIVLLTPLLSLVADFSPCCRHVRLLSGGNFHS